MEGPRRKTPQFSWPAFFTAVAVLYFLYKIHVVLIPFVLSFALAYLMNPVIHHFEAHGFRREHVVLGLYCVIAAGIAAAANFMLPAMMNELDLLQGRAGIYYAAIQQTFSTLQDEAVRRLPFGQHIVERMSLKMYNPLMEQLPKLPSYILGLFPLLSLIFLVPFIAFFVLMDSENFLQDAVQICPSRHVEQVLHIFSEIDTSLGNYVRGILIVAAAIGVASYIGLMALGVDYALAVATLSGVSSFIPYLGAVMGAVVGGGVAFFQFHTFWAPLKVVILFFGIRLADEALLQPLISRHSMHLHPLLFLLALMVGGKIFGFVGLLFAVPAACILKALIGVAWDYYSTQIQTAPRMTLDGTEIPYV
ncbi:MAG: AI-2E family transporter [Elusimicrobia bacterium]|nr:AI-2E family transporter [Elusimicrobiota bacterium]